MPPKTKCVKKIAPRPPYALVVYSNGTAGVVESTSVAKSAKEGSAVTVPDPVDWEGKRSSKKHKAKLVQFGYSIEFLYGVNVSPRGEVLSEGDSEHIRVQKSEEKRREDEAKLARAAVEGNFNKCVSSLPKIIGSTETADRPPTPTITPTIATAIAVESGGDSSAGANQPKIIGSTETADRPPTPTITPTIATAIAVESGGDSSAGANQPKIIGSTETADRPPTPTITPTIATAIAVESGGDSSAGANKESASLPATLPSSLVPFVCPEDLPNCPLNKVLQHASPSKIAFLDEVCQAVAAHKHVDTDKNPPKKAKKRTRGGNIDWDSLDCFKREPGKHNLVNNGKIFLPKQKSMGIPPIKPAPAQKRARGKRNENFLYPRQMVRHLLFLIIPEEKILENRVTATQIPSIIRDEIAAYTNYRLPAEARLTDSMVIEYINDDIRSLFRDREAEKETRKKKKQKNAVQKETHDNHSNSVFLEQIQGEFTPNQRNTIILNPGEIEIYDFAKHGHMFQDDDLIVEES